jgi:nucleotide-binding universal stress UspA family protein
VPTPIPPFSHLLVPYDGSEPARAALRLAIRIAAHGATISIATIVDETPVMAQSASAMAFYDTTPLLEALDAQGRALLEDAAAQCRAATIEPVLLSAHDRPIAGILALAEAGPCDLIVIGTHARTGVARTFLGSTTESILRMSRVPVITVRSADHIADAPFATALVAVDDSGPADAAVALAARLALTIGTKIIACHVVDTQRLYEGALGLSFGFAAADLTADLRREATAIVNGALTRAGLPENTPMEIVDGDPGLAIIGAAENRKATVIIAGTHGRRGLSRFALGSVAENIVRASDLPVLVVRS